MVTQNHWSAPQVTPSLQRIFWPDVTAIAEPLTDSLLLKQSPWQCEHRRSFMPIQLDQPLIPREL